MKQGSLSILLFATACAGLDPARAPAPMDAIPPAHANVPAGTRTLGTVHFPTSCSSAAQPHLERGLALLHHMTYDQARESFTGAAQADAACGMAYWGQAMTLIHPLWPDVISEGDLRRGWELVTRARTGRQTERERGYVEAAAFHALSHMATAVASDKSFEKQRRAGRIAERVLEQEPNHPGGHHYVIHAYDSPPLAERALAVARSYGKVAPDVPHALHMPTHIFTRRGLWQESVAWNRRSAEAAWLPNGALMLKDHLHALDYLVYAYLQGAEDRRAEAVLRGIERLEMATHPHPAVPYTLAAVPVRLALERQRWQDASEIEPRQPSVLAWDEVPYAEAISHFARALGAAHQGDAARARQAAAKLGELRDRSATMPYDWATQVEIQRLGAQAWLSYAEGDESQALALQRQAAELESSTEKSPVTPGEVLPARELLGDLLLELERPEAALAEYERALERSPGRFNSLYGAGRAAELAGDQGKATTYYRELLENCRPADSTRPRLERARAYLAGR